jgi:hypothetical protein
MAQHKGRYPLKKGSVLLCISLGVLWAEPVAAFAEVVSKGAVSASQSDNNIASEAVAQMPSVSELSDVGPEDWAYQAVLSLVQDYGCLSGYPDGTFRGDRFMTRFEFAASLHACLEAFRELGLGSTDSAISPTDVETIRRLQEEYASELALLRGQA